MAGPRSNTLVAIGAASFVVFASLFPDEGSPTRVAAQLERRADPGITDANKLYLQLRVARNKG
jgi:hypothetical protein